MGIEALESMHSLNGWIEKNGFTGYDPYDVKGNRWVIWLTRAGNRNAFFAAIRELIFEVFYIFPVLSRKILRIYPQVNAKAMGILASSYLDLYISQQNSHYLQQAKQCIEWLKSNGVQPESGIGWGYPFTWQSASMIPAGTPNGIVTTAVGDAFWKHYKIFNDKESLEYCVEISKFLNSLPVDFLNQDQICYSYTPLFINHVHNLNLFVAEFLIKTGLETGNNNWISSGHKAVNYTISNQLKNGAFDYNGPPERLYNHIDNYHTGFVLRMLHSIWQLTGREDVFLALQQCYSHFISHFFEDKRIPKLMPGRKYRIDIHSCAESIHCLCTLSTTFPEGVKLADNILNWTIDHLQHKSGYFFYGILKSRFTGLPFISKIPYIRWGQAWMLRALTSYIMCDNNMKV